MQTNLEEIVKIQPRGLFTIPKKLRTTLRLFENSLVRVKSEKGRLVVEPVRTFPYPVRSYTEEDIKQFIELDKKESEVLKKKGII